MLAAMQSETGKFAEAVSTAQTALLLAKQQQNDGLAASLQANLSPYRGLAWGEPQSGVEGPR
jgi:hypothetical protein